MFLNRIGMKFGRNALQVNTHRLTESGFQLDVTLSRWRPRRHFAQKSVAAWRVHMQHPVALLTTVSDP